MNRNSRLMFLCSYVPDAIWIWYWQLCIIFITGFQDLPSCPLLAHGRPGRTTESFTARLLPASRCLPVDSSQPASSLNMPCSKWVSANSLGHIYRLGSHLAHHPLKGRAAGNTKPQNTGKQNVEKPHFQSARRAAAAACAGHEAGVTSPGAAPRSARAAAPSLPFPSRSCAGRSCAATVRPHRRRAPSPGDTFPRGPHDGEKGVKQQPRLTPGLLSQGRRESPRRPPSH